MPPESPLRRLPGSSLKLQTENYKSQNTGSKIFLESSQVQALWTFDSEVGPDCERLASKTIEPLQKALQFERERLLFEWALLKGTMNSTFKWTRSKWILALDALIFSNWWFTSGERIKNICIFSTFQVQPLHCSRLQLPDRAAKKILISDATLFSWQVVV